MFCDSVSKLNKARSRVQINKIESVGGKTGNRTQESIINLNIVKLVNFGPQRWPELLLLLFLACLDAVVMVFWIQFWTDKFSYMSVNYSPN